MKYYAKIQYRDFYDIPRIFLTRHEGNLLLFDCKFDEPADDYEKRYRIYLMPDLDEQTMRGDWTSLPDKAKKLVGEVATSDVEFDSTKRREINVDVFARLNLAAGSGLSH